MLPTQDVIVTVIDASSGVDQVAREIDPTGTPDQDPFGYSYGERPAAGPVQFTVEAPYSGWTLGRHVLRVYSSDKAGNTTHQDLAFTASATAGQRSRSSTTWKACGSIRSRAIYRLRTARGPSCTIAKRVARRANRHRRAQVSGYACSRTSKTYTCRRASKLIRWNRS